MEPCFVRTCFDEEAATREDNNELGFATMARDLGTGCQTADHIAVWSPNNAKWHGGRDPLVSCCFSGHIHLVHMKGEAGPIKT